MIAQGKAIPLDIIREVPSLLENYYSRIVMGVEKISTCPSSSGR